MSGAIRGVVRDGVTVPVGTKLAELDPRGENAQIAEIGERPARIAAGVLRAIPAGIGATSGHR